MTQNPGVNGQNQVRNLSLQNLSIKHMRKMSVNIVTDSSRNK